MDEQKVCFISCVNDKITYQECLLYLQQLTLPAGMKSESFAVYDADSMAEGYWEAMRQSDAKYKIYLHQDVRVVERTVVERLLNIFLHHPEIGMLGLAGCKKLNDDGIWWLSEGCCGKIAELQIPEQLRLIDYGPVGGEFEYVDALDGVFLATQVDIPWRQDVFKGWHFYDISQCMEFQRAGYKISVMHQEYPYCIHASKYKLLGEDYMRWQKVFLQEYAQV